MVGNGRIGVAVGGWVERGIVVGSNRGCRWLLRTRSDSLINRRGFGMDSRPSIRPKNPGFNVPGSPDRCWLLATAQNPIIEHMQVKTIVRRMIRLSQALRLAS